MPPRFISLSFKGNKILFNTYHIVAIRNSIEYEVGSQVVMIGGAKQEVGQSVTEIQKLLEETKNA